MLKSCIVETLGEKSLLLPHYLGEALKANARAKYLFALLQAAKAHAEHPHRLPADLRGERQAAQINDATLDGVVAGSRRLEKGLYKVPQSVRIHADLFAAVAEMIRPLRVKDENNKASTFDDRLSSLDLSLAAPKEDLVSSEYITGMTAARPGQSDTLHQLVMDLHKALNRLQSDISVGNIDGAAVYGLGDGDEPRVAAFMRGLNTTAPLKFDHPGLGTTATRRGQTLVIQNDIGTTDAHVLIIEAEVLTTTLRYTDIHRKRARFFQNLFKAFDVRWENTLEKHNDALTEGSDFYLCTGRHLARDTQEQERYLAFLGSRIVFLIDWNRARKRLSNFVGTKEAIDILHWAANNNLGHRGFLQAGGEALIFAAIEQAGRGLIRYGQQLDEVLGNEATCEFLRFVLRTAAESSLANRSLRLIQDEVKAELLKLFQSAELTAIALACDHAALIAEIAALVRDGLIRLAAGAGTAGEQDAHRAKIWESRADKLLIRLRELGQATPGAIAYRNITEEADDGADSLEEAAFLLGLAGGVELPAQVIQPLQRLATAGLMAAQEYVKTVECAAWLQHSATREDVNDFLEAVDRTVEFEHETDTCEREVTAELMRSGGDGRSLRLYGDLAGLIEESADALRSSALMLRDHVLGEVLAL
ncbi:hypothetical protein [Methylomicrobium lacus]|uniref:hypothetical protein n=1 Tax=Methylomicrobium lacus TaxID=136992 RepID=UPI0035A8BD7C